MATRELSGPPSILPLYAKAALPMIPGASKLPFVPGAGKDVPDLELVMPEVTFDTKALAAYRWGSATSNSDGKSTWGSSVPSSPPATTQTNIQAKALSTRASAARSRRFTT